MLLTMYHINNVNSILIIIAFSSLRFVFVIDMHLNNFALGLFYY